MNLALFFGYHVLWPKGFAGEIDRVSVVLAVAAAVALFRYKRNVIEVIAVGALVGIALMLLGL